MGPARRATETPYSTTNRHQGTTSARGKRVYVGYCYATFWQGGRASPRESVRREARQHTIVLGNRRYGTATGNRWHSTVTGGMVQYGDKRYGTAYWYGRAREHKNKAQSTSRCKKKGKMSSRPSARRGDGGRVGVVFSSRGRVSSSSSVRVCGRPGGYIQFLSLEEHRSVSGLE